MSKLNLHRLGAAQLALLAILVALGASGCRVTLDESQAIGSWECRRGERVSCVDVRSDHTYSQIITVNSREELSTSANWDWELKAGDGMAISFTRFHHIADDGSSIRQPPGFWIVVPETRVPFGSPELVVSDDDHIAYTKRDTPCPTAKAPQG